MISTGARFIQDLRDKKQSDEAIRKKLLAAEWTAEEIDGVFKELDDPTPPPPPHKNTSDHLDTNEKPLSVVHRSSTIGIEYGVAMISLAVAAISVGTLTHNYLDVAFGQTDSFSHPLAISGAIIGLPLFLLLFLRLHQLERRQPLLKADSSRRHWIQATLLVSFLVGIGHIIFYVYNLVDGSMSNNYYSDYLQRPQPSAAEYQLLQLGHLLVTLAIAGSIFAYYWLDEHRQKQ